VTLPPPREREIEVSALRTSRRALAMRETAAAPSLEAFREVIVLDARIINPVLQGGRRTFEPEAVIPLGRRDFPIARYLNSIAS
jgi:hypothetical protein